MSEIRFIEELEKISSDNTKVRAILRRSLAFKPGAFIQAYPYVEPFIAKEKVQSHKREMFYLVAGLWALHWREGRTDNPKLLGKACAVYQLKTESKNTESRFINLLDSDLDQLPQRLRQIIMLLKDYSIDFSALLTGLVFWENPEKYTQKNWARDFYHNYSEEPELEIKQTKEILI